MSKSFQSFGIDADSDIDKFLSDEEENKMDTMEQKLQLQKLETEEWMKKYVESKKKEKNEKAQMLRRLGYYKKLFGEIVQNIKKTKVQAHKRIMKNVMKQSLQTVRAPHPDDSVRKFFYERRRKKNKNRQLLHKDKYRELRSKVLEFYLNDENSTPAPGLRDFITRNKIKQRKRYLCDTLFNLRKKFCAQNNVTVGKRFF